MSSWVAPSIAAEIWGISVEQIMAGIANGSIPSYVDGQFLFVDIAGQGIVPSSPLSKAAESVVSAREFAALTFEPRDAEPSPQSTDASPIDEKEEVVRDAGNWRSARRQSERLRQPPTSEAA
jgi:hypothetical protein